MKVYVIAYWNDDTRKYLTTLYKDSTSHSSDLDQAMKCVSIDVAKAIIEQLKSVNNYTYKIYCIETTFTEVN